MKAIYIPSADATIALSKLNEPVSVSRIRSSSEMSLHSEIIIELHKDTEMQVSIMSMIELRGKLKTTRGKENPIPSLSLSWIHI